MDKKIDLLKFLKSQKLLVLATHDKDTWISNLYYGVDDNFKIYFISSDLTKHAKQILENPNVAFSVAWYNQEDHADRKAVQGIGNCRVANEEEIKRGIGLHNKNFPEFTDEITLEWVNNPDNKSHVWFIEPSYMKFWNDQLYGDEEFEEFNFT